MKILGQLQNATNSYIYQAQDVQNAPLAVHAYTDLDGLLPELLANRLVIKTINFNYRLYADDGVAYSTGQLLSISGTDVDLAGNSLINVNGISIDNTVTASIYSTVNGNQSINYLDTGDLSIGAEAKVEIGFNGAVNATFTDDGLNLHTGLIENLKDGVNDYDAVNKSQSENYVDGEFKKANSALSDAHEFQIDLRDLTRSAGYGNASGKVSYFSVGNDFVVNPDTSYGLMFFLHESIESKIGFFMIHESLLGSHVTSATQSIPFRTSGSQGALGKSGSTAASATGDPDAIWNCTGGAIKSRGNDANVLPAPYGYYDMSYRADYAKERSRAYGCTFSFGPFSLVGSPEIVRAQVKNINDYQAEMVPDPNSSWFVGKATAGGAVFNTKKLFMLFLDHYSECTFSTGDYALSLGLKVQDNQERIEVLEERVEELTPTSVYQSLVTSNTNTLVNAIASANRNPGLSAYVF